MHGCFSFQLVLVCVRVEGNLENSLGRKVPFNGLNFQMSLFYYFFLEVFFSSYFYSFVETKLDFIDEVNWRLLFLEVPSVTLAHIL